MALLRRITPHPLRGRADLENPSCRDKNERLDPDSSTLLWCLYLEESAMKWALRLELDYRSINHIVTNVC
jgi:hypothetical protein